MVHLWRDLLKGPLPRRQSPLLRGIDIHSIWIVKAHPAGGAGGGTGTTFQSLQNASKHWECRVRF